MRVSLPKTFLVALLMVSAACAVQLPAPTAEDAVRASARWPGYGDRELAEGHRMYILNCSSCHTLYRPMAYTEHAWEELFPEMAEEARLDSTESDMILKYLLVMSGALPAL